jgi:hypothetical protein
VNIIKSFKLDKAQLKAALTQWLNTSVLKEPIEIEGFNVNYDDSVDIELKERIDYPTAPVITQTPVGNAISGADTLFNSLEQSDDLPTF